MGHIFALSGCSGAGKTKLLNKLFSESRDHLRLLVRSTSRQMRKHERQEIDYEYLSPDDFLQKLFASDYIHVEQVGGSFFGIDAHSIEEVLSSNDDGIIMAGRGAFTLKASFGSNVTVLFLYTGTRQSLLNPGCLDISTPENVELIRRLHEKCETGVFHLEDDSASTRDKFVRNRMHQNVLDLAFVNGRIRSGDDVTVIANIRDRLDDALRQFLDLRALKRGFPPLYAKRNSCFVLMPFREPLKPVFEDHIKPTLEALGLHVFRADGIFSTRPVMDDIMESVRTARIIVADLTDNNPNVFYETGICHALGKSVILITQNTEVPFDLSHLRRITYEYTPRGALKFEESLSDTVLAILNS